jgi:tellurite resistance protein TehA-like permease
MSAKAPELPSQLKSAINYKVIGLIVGIFVGMLIYDYKYQDYVNNNFTLTDVVIILAPIAGGIAGIFVAKRYWPSVVFGKTYLALGIALLLYGAGNTAYEYLSDIAVPNSQPYPSIGDGFWICMYPFFYYHLIRNIKHFRKTGRRPLVWILA